MAGHVYLIGSTAFSWYKIGKSSDATIRLVDLGILLPFRIEVIAVTRADAYEYLERSLHRKYASCRVNGEWFKFDNKHILEVVQDMSFYGTMTTAMLKFTNLERDAAPEGKVPVVRYKKKKRQFTREERERIKQTIVAAKASLPPREKCPTCQRFLPWSPEHKKFILDSYVTQWNPPSA